MTGAFVPTFSAIRRGVCPMSFHSCVKHIWICRRNIHTNSPYISSRKSVSYLIPMRSAIGAFVHRAVGAAAEVRVHVSSALMGGGIKRLWVARIHMNFVETSMVVDV